ncbi:MAG: pseudouridine synthase [Bryobacteraceae bacterium]
MPEERLQKILAHLGVASRRKAEELIVQGKVQVNGKTIVELGSKADPERDEIRVIGKHIRPPRQKFYVLLHKPKGCVTTTSDPERRETVMDLVREIKERIYPVGRLDYNSEGALLLTNDGDFANAILSAKSKIKKIYEVKVNGYLTPEQEDHFRAGIPLHGRRTRPCGLRLSRRAENPWYEVTLEEGRTHQIRDMFAHFGRLVEKLRRTQIGFLKLGTLPPAEWRLLTADELRQFQKVLGIKLDLKLELK